MTMEYDDVDATAFILTEGQRLFPGFSNESIFFWWKVEDFTSELYTRITFLNFYLAFPGFFLNVFHLWILTRRSLMTSSTNILTIGICICDLVAMATLGQQYILNRYSIYRKEWLHECATPDSLFTVVLTHSMRNVSYFLRRLSIWLGVLLAAIRAIIVKNPTNRIADTMGTRKFGYLSVFLAFLVALPLPLLSKMGIRVETRAFWTAPPTCPEFPPNYSQPIYWVIYKNLFGSAVGYLLVYLDSWLFRIAPSILFPILSLVLLAELRKARSRLKTLQRSSSAEDVRNCRTTRVVLWMTVSFVFAAAPQGVISLLLNFSVGYQGFINILLQMTSIFLLSESINALTHVLIPALISSQYQKTVRELCCCATLKIANNVST